jgi:hypothetical protein
MDAEVPLTNGAAADGEVVWSRRLDAGVKLADLFPTTTAARKPDRRGEHEGSRKTIAQGRPDRCGVPVVTISYAQLFLHARLRAPLAPGFPCALCLLEGRVCCKARARFRRGNADARL